MGMLHHRRAWRSSSGRTFLRARARVWSPRSRSVLLCALALLLLLSLAKRPGVSCDTRVPALDTVVSSSPSRSPKKTPDFRVVVLTHSRVESLLRLLRSASAAHYDGDRIDLDIWVDRSLIPDPEPASWAGRTLRALLPTPQPHSAPPDAAVLATASAFDWPHGEKAVHVWDQHVGIWGQWVDSYRPSPSSPGAVLLEDDLEVSAQYYRWLLGARSAYGSRDDVFGYTLQRGTLRANATGFGRRGLKIPASEKAFLYLLLGSWGYAPEPRQWVKFRAWFHEKSCSRGYHPYIEGLLPTKWYRKQEKGRTMWTMWHIKFAEVMGLYTVYANLEGERTLAANWREPGLHFKKSERKKASAVTKRRDFELLSEGHGREGDGVFAFPREPRRLAWNGTFVGRDGVRTRQ